MSRTAVILLAAGAGKRMAGAVPDKVLAPLAGRPVFAYSAAAFAASGVADLYVVVYRDRSQMTALSAFAPTPALLVRGGRDRQDSVSAALAALPADIDHVFIHDCARPMIRPEQLVALHKIVRRKRAVVLAHRVTDSIKQHRSGGRLRTVDRSNLWAMETPQVFAKALIARASPTTRPRSSAWGIPSRSSRTPIPIPS
jgi:2-C-methyl-D-erythritol 4-phosphate cytidylyltransferase